MFYKYPNETYQQFVERLVKFCIKTETDHCIEYPGFKDWKGYGRVSLKNGTTSANRYACRLAHGEPEDESMHAHHKCHNPSCFNPNHLEWKTHRENLWEGGEDGRPNPFFRFGDENASQVHKESLLDGGHLEGA